MKIRLDHVAIAVQDIKAAVDDFERTLGIDCERVESVPTEGADVAFFDVGGPHLELISPMNDDAPLARSLEKRGEGIHHICLEVEDIQTAMDALKAKGIRLVSDTPKPGAGGSKIVFVHPKSLHGVLVELVEKP